jgi:hypothetical protein
MLIPHHAMKNFIVNENDDEFSIRLKNYYLSKNKIHRRQHAENNLKELNKKYDRILKMRNKTSIEKLKIQLAIEELLN